jgi:hypothetical protein
MVSFFMAVMLFLNWYLWHAFSVHYIEAPFVLKIQLCIYFSIHHLYTYTYHDLIYAM